MGVVQERDANNLPLVNYVRDGNIGGLLSKTDVASGNNYFYHYDSNGNVAQLTSSAGNSVAEYSYDAYGNTLRSWGYAASSNPYRYQTKEQHAQSGLYDFGYRFYNSGNGRWLTRDPLNEGGGLNMYGAFANNPLMYGDAYGLSIGGDALTGFKSFFNGKAAGLATQWWNGDPHATRESVSNGDTMLGVGPGAVGSIYSQGTAIMRQVPVEGEKCQTKIDWQKVSAWNRRASFILGVGQLLSGGGAAKQAGTARSAPVAASAAAPKALPFRPILTQGFQRTSASTGRMLNGGMGVDHIVARHFSTSGFAGVSKFGSDIGLRELADLIDNAAVNGTFTMEGTSIIIEANAGCVIGVAADGVTPASMIKVVVNKAGEVVTAHPY